MFEQKLSIVIPVYNSENYLDRCVDSVVNQTYKNLEIILVDDGSTDNSLKLCNQWAIKDNRIVVIHKSNGGVSSARNTGIDMATGSFLGFVDSDDYLKPRFFEHLMDKISNDVDLVVSGFQIIDVKGNCKEYKLGTGNISNILHDIDEFLQFIIDFMFDMSWNKIYRKSLITKPFLEGQVLSEDKIFNFNYFQNISQRIVSVDENGYVYKFNPTSACNQKRKNKYPILLKATYKLRDFLINQFGTYNNKKFYDIYLADVAHVLRVCDKDEMATLSQQIKNDGIFDDFIKDYKPLNWKEKIKFYLLKRGKFTMLKSILKIKQ